MISSLRRKPTRGRDLGIFSLKKAIGILNHITTLKHNSTNKIIFLKVANDMEVSKEDDINTKAITYFSQRGAIDDGADDPFDLLG